MKKQLKYCQPFFCYNPEDTKSADFARELQADLGTFTIDESDIIVDVGGDGTILYGFQHYPDLPHFALKPPTSRSKLFHGHHNIQSADELLDAFNGASLNQVIPLEGHIHMSDGSDVNIRAYGDIIISALTAQATLLELKLNEGPSHRLMSGGLIIASPLGSTARNGSCSGLKLNLTSTNMVITSDGFPLMDDDEFFAESENGNSREVSSDTAINIDLKSLGKRPIIVHYDSSSIMPDGQVFREPPFVVSSERQIEGITITSAPHQTRHLLRNEKYATHALEM